MARTVAKLSVYKGRYQRVLGQAINSKGKLAPKKFLLGTDPQKAKLANARLEQLWDEVVAEHDHTLGFVEKADISLGDMNMITGEPAVPGDVQARRDFEGGPRWRGESLILAEAIRKHERSVSVPAWPTEKPHVYLHRIANLQKTYTAIDIVPGDKELLEEGKLETFVESRKHHAQSRFLAEMAEIPAPNSSQSLHEAMEAYAASRPDRESGKVEAANARRLKDAHPDIPLDRLTMSALQKLGDYWRERPNSKASGKPVSLYTVKNHLDTARRFVRWLERHDGYAYSPPRHWEETLKADTRRLRTADETAALAKGVPVWRIDELTELYRHADDTARLLILLGLNLGAAQAEMRTLRIGEINRDEQPPKVKRVRHKSGVYGEFALWPETLRAIDWQLAQRRKHKGENDTVLLAGKGEPWIRQRFANVWNRLLKRVTNEHPDFRRLPFKTLRKTGAQLVRHHGGGEIMGVFLCHGKPVPTDALSDVYSNRPFDRVAEALEAVHADLTPMFGASPNAFIRSSKEDRKRSSTPTSTR